MVRVEAQIVQRRRIEPGACVGYNATFTAEQTHELAIVNLGYADGYLRGFSGTGRARIGDRFAPVVGRVSMDSPRSASTPRRSSGKATGSSWITTCPAPRRSRPGPIRAAHRPGARFERVWK